MCLTPFNPMDYSLPGSSVHGILQARILEWVVIPFSRGPSWPRDETHDIYVSCRQILYHLNHQGSPLNVWKCKPIKDSKFKPQLEGFVNEGKKREREREKARKRKGSRQTNKLQPLLKKKKERKKKHWGMEEDLTWKEIPQLWTSYDSVHHHSPWQKIFQIPVFFSSLEKWTLSSLGLFFLLFSSSATAAKSLQSCLTLCSPIPGILQARTLEWVAISFSNA